jgi:hypothetical protein
MKREWGAVKMDDDGIRVRLLILDFGGTFRTFALTGPYEGP